MKNIIFTNRQLIILDQLMSNDITTAQELSLISDVSIRTIKKEIKELKELLEEKGIELQSISGQGYQIKNKEINFIENKLEKINQIKMINNYSKSNSNRVSYIVQKFLTAKDYTKIEDMADQIYVSRTTIQNDIKDARILLKRFNLKLNTKPGQGLILEGDQFNKLLAISEYFFHNTLSLVDKRTKEQVVDSIESIEVIKEIINNTCHKYHISISDFSIHNIAIHCAIMIHQRELANGEKDKEINEVEIENKDKNNKINTINEPNPVFTHIALEILNQTSKELQIKEFSNDEIQYIALHLDSKQIMTRFELVPEEDLTLIDHIFAEILNNFGIDLSQNLKLKKFLSMHIHQMIKRIENGLTIRNSLVYQNLREFLFATKVTISAVSIIELFNKNIKISLDEFGYLLLYFQGALIEQRTYPKIEIGLISGHGRAEEMLYQQELEDKFDHESINITVYNSPESIKEPIDIAVTITEIDIKKANETVSIDKGNYLKKIETLIKRQGIINVDLNKYIKEENIIHLEGNNKIQVTQNLIKKMDQMKLLKPYHDQEIFTTHEIGNGVVHLQDIKKQVDKPVCLLAILEQPIIWDQTEVRVLLFIKTKKDGDNDLYVLCELFSRWVNNKNKVQSLIEEINFKEFEFDLYN